MDILEKAISLLPDFDAATTLLNEHKYGGICPSYGRELDVRHLTWEYSCHHLEDITLLKNGCIGEYSRDIHGISPNKFEISDSGHTIRVGLSKTPDSFSQAFPTSHGKPLVISPAARRPSSHPSNTSAP